MELYTDFIFFFFFQAEDGIRDVAVTGVQTCALPICEICQHILMEAIWPEDGERNPRALELVLDFAVPGREGPCEVARAERGVQDDVTYAGGEAGLDHVAFQLHQVGNW